MNNGSTYRLSGNNADQTSSINGSMTLSGNVTFENKRHAHTISGSVSGSGTLTLLTVLIFAACLVGELAERYLFFTAVVRDRMPGGSA